MGGIATNKITMFWWKRKRKRGSGSGGSGPKIDRFQNTGGSARCVCSIRTILFQFSARCVCSNAVEVFFFNFLSVALQDEYVKSEAQVIS